MNKKPSFLSLAKKGLTLSLSNIWRNKFLSLATIFVIGTMIFIFNIILAVNFIAQDALNDLGKKIDIVVYLKESTNYSDTQNLINEFENIDLDSPSTIQDNNDEDDDDLFNDDFDLNSAIDELTDFTEKGNAYKSTNPLTHTA